MSEIHFVLNKQGTLNPTCIWTGIFASLERLGRGAKIPPLPNLDILSQMTMKVGKNILWVEIFTN